MNIGLRGKVVLASGVAVLVALLATTVVASAGFDDQERAAMLLRIAGVGVLVTAVVLALLGVVLQRWVVRPLTRVVRVMDRVRRGEQDYSARLSTRGGDEVAILSEGFNGLVQAVALRERELVAAKDAAEEGSRVKTQFMAVMSHELRTPLNAVLGMAELLQSTQLDARQQSFVAQIMSSGRSLVDIIDDVLDLTRLDAGKLQPVNEPFRLRDTVFDTVDMFRDRAEVRSLELAVHVDASLPDVVRGDMMQLRQILANLLSNAIKFTEQGGVIVRVTQCDLGLRFSVSDTGVGVASDFMPHIYEAFRQGDSSTTRRFGGAGLGLSIARRLCVAMGGRIDASSRPGKGSTFWFELPLPAVPAGMPDVPADPAPAVPTPAAHTPLTKPAASVLLIEDDGPTQQLVALTLAGTGYALTIARDGTEALRCVRKYHFDLVLLDWQLPGVDGLAVLAALREAEAAQSRARAHVIAATAHTAPGDRETCLAAGADDYLGKPYSPADLLRHMDAAMALRQTQR